MPVIPPRRNMKRKSKQNNIGVSDRILPRHIVAIQLKNLIPVGTAIRIDMAAKEGLLTTPVTNMWCAHTEKLYASMRMVASMKPR